MLKLASKFLPEPHAFEQVFNAGFRNAELYLNAQVLEQADDVIDMARQFDMNYAMHFPNKPELSDDHLKACCRLFDELEISAVVIHPPMLKRYGAALKAIHPDIVLGIETMRVPPEELVAWVQEHGTVTLDMEHIWKFSLQDAPIEQLFALVRSVFERAAECVVHVHMPGYLPGPLEHRPMYTSREFCMGVFDILAEHKFQGLVVSEVDLEFQNPLELKMDAMLFERWMEIRSSATVTAESC